LKINTGLVHNLIIQLIAGLIIAFISTILIYFKQKPVLHHITIIISVGSIAFISSVIRAKIRAIPALLTFIFLGTLIIICWIYPQFLYQFRPYTFYITGFAVGGIVITAIASQLLVVLPTSLPRNIIIIFTGYVLGLWIPSGILQYLIIGLLILYLITFYTIIKPGFKPTFALAVTFAIVSQLYFQFSKSIIFHPEQERYEDKIVFTSQTQYHQLVITQWKEDYWFFMDKLKNICSIDEFLFYEPMVHSAFQVSENIHEVLVLGGENGCLVREVLKYNDVSKIDVVSYDTLLRKIGQENQFYIAMNQQSLENQKVNIIHQNLLDFVSNNKRKYDVVFIDLPDPRSIETNQYYTLEFYSILLGSLKDQGLMVTQAGSPYFATEAFYSVGKTIAESGYHALPIHNQILTLGEWGWYICSKNLTEKKIKNIIINMDSEAVETEWWDPGAAKLITSFGKTYSDTLNVGINTLDNPLVYQYYLKGNWDMN